MILAVIPARGGSKRIPRKNVRPFCGKPIIAYSIECALATKLFDAVVVSTDSNEIAEIAKAHGAEVPFERPSELSDDYTPTIPVVKHAIGAIESTSEEQVSFACCIYATAPFVQTTSVLESFELLQSDRSADFCFPVTSFPFPIWRGVKLNDQNCVEMLWPENGNKRSQDLEETYHDAGQFYWGTRSAWRRATNIFQARSKALIVPRERVQDIDTLADWNRAEAMFDVLRTQQTSASRQSK